MKSILALSLHLRTSFNRRFAVVIGYIITITVLVVILVRFASVGQAAMATDCYSGPGCLDASFNGTGKVLMAVGITNSWAEAVALQTDGKIVVAGFGNVVTGHQRFYVARFNSDGSLDATFGSGGMNSIELTPSGDQEIPNAIKIQPDGKIVVAGIVGSSPGVARFNSDGTIDNTFGSGGAVITDFGSGTSGGADGLAIQSDGRIVLCGGAAPAFGFVRLNADGSLDTSFGTGGKKQVSWGSTTIYANNTSAHALALQTINGQEMIVAVGDVLPTSKSKTYDFGVVRLTSTGALDTSFATGGKFSTDFYGNTDNAYSVAIDANNNIVVGGRTIVPVNKQTTNYNFAAIRVTANGTLDTSFNGSGKVDVDILGGREDAMAVSIQSDGKICLAGFALDPVTSISDFALVRLQSNGQLDGTFGTNGKTTTNFVDKDSAYNMAIQPDGKILLVGASRLYVGSTTAQWALARYLP
jgi:uncharacterized delta-60 repeat protein